MNPKPNKHMNRSSVLTGKVTLVTGASSGIGRKIAQLLAQRGARVFGTARKPSSASPLPGVEFVRMDVTDEDSVSAALEEIAQKAGPIEILVNNAGYGLTGALEETNLEEAREQFETNFFGVLRVTNAVLPGMRKAGRGRIANISSVVGFIPAPFMGIYAASKHALEGYTETLDHEVRQFGVRAVLIQPSYTKSNINQNEKTAQTNLNIYAAQRQRMHEVVVKGVKNGDEPQLVAEAVWRAVTAKSPRLRYPVGQGVLLNQLRRFAPAALFDLAIRKASSLGKFAMPRIPAHHSQSSRLSMKALILKKYSGPAQVVFADIPKPTLKPHEILVQVHAVGLNPIDNAIPTGSFKPIIRLQLPATMGSDLAGVVVEVGSRVTRFQAGDAVFASIFDLGSGSLAEFALVPESAAALKPSNLDFVQAASVPMVGLTSWQAIKERAQLRPGQKVFIPAGSGGIGTFAIQLAKHLGATVGTTTSTGNVEFVRSLGADEVLDYKKQAFEKVLRDYDVVLGTVRGDAIKKSLGILKSHSRIISLVGPPDVAFAHSRSMNFLLKSVFSLLSGGIIRKARKIGAEYSFLFVHPDGDQLGQIGELLESGKIRPVIDKVFPFEQAKEALAYLEQGRAKGKVVVQLR